MTTITAITSSVHPGLRRLNAIERGEVVLRWEGKNSRLLCGINYYYYWACRPIFSTQNQHDPSLHHIPRTAPLPSCKREVFRRPSAGTLRGACVCGGRAVWHVSCSRVLDIKRIPTAVTVPCPDRRLSRACALAISRVPPGFQGGRLRRACEQLPRPALWKLSVAPAFSGRRRLVSQSARDEGPAGVCWDWKRVAVLVHFLIRRPGPACAGAGAGLPAGEFRPLRVAEVCAMPCQWPACIYETPALFWTRNV